MRDKMNSGKNLLLYSINTPQQIIRDITLLRMGTYMVHASFQQWHVKDQDV